MALSSNSARRWVVPATALPTSATSSARRMLIRWYCWVSPIAASRTRRTRTGLWKRRPVWPPARMIEVLQETPRLGELMVDVEQIRQQRLVADPVL